MAMSRSLGMTIRVSTFSLRRWIPSSACTERRDPSKLKGLVTTPIVSAPELLATSATTGAAPVPVPPALARSDEHHVGSVEGLADLVDVLLGRLSPDLGIAAGTQAAGQVPADVDTQVGVAHAEGLGIGVGRNELHAPQARVDHPVHGVDAAASDADHPDDGDVVVRVGHHRVNLPDLRYCILA